MKRIESLIDRLENDNFNNAVFKDWYTLFLNKDFSHFTLEELYSNIYGFIYGLHTLDYIDGDMCKLLINEIFDHYKSCL